MLYKLDAKQYQRVGPVFEELRYNLVIDSVIDGNTPAWVYADAKRFPRSAWMWNRQDAMLVAGNEDNDAFNRVLADLIAEKVIPDAKQRGIPLLSLHYSPQSWESVIDRVLLKGGRAEKARRRYYALGELNIDWKAHMPLDSQMVRIDEKLLARTDLHNIDSVVGWVRSYWCSNREFAQTGFGLCLLMGDTVASWCLSVYVSGRNLELGLATVPDFRNKGLATLTAAACVEHCLINGIVPHWHCWDDNYPSVAVAGKLGFERPTGYTVYRLKTL